MSGTRFDWFLFGALVGSLAQTAVALLLYGGMP